MVGGGNGNANICKVRLGSGSILDCVGPKSHLTAVGPCVDVQYDPVDVLKATGYATTRPAKLRVLFQHKPALLYWRAENSGIAHFDEGKQTYFTLEELRILVARRELCFFDHHAANRSDNNTATSRNNHQQTNDNNNNDNDNGKNNNGTDDDDNGWMPGQDGDDDEFDEDIIRAAHTISALGEHEIWEEEQEQDDSDFEDDGKGGAACNPALLDFVRDILQHGIPRIRKCERIHYPNKFTRIVDSLNIPLPSTLQLNQSTVPTKSVAARFRRLAIVDPYSLCPEYAPRYGELECPYCGECENVKLNGFTDGIRAVATASEPFGCILRKFKCHGCREAKVGCVTRSFTIMHDKVLSQMDEAFIEMIEVVAPAGVFRVQFSLSWPLDLSSPFAPRKRTVSRFEKNLRRHIAGCFDRSSQYWRGEL